jgi:hypothetical protein
VCIAAEWIVILHRLSPIYACTHSRAVYNSFWVFAAKGLSDVAVPTYREVSLQYVRDFFGRDLRPFNCYSFWAQERGLMIRPLNLAKLSSARCAVLVEIPTREDIPNQAILRTNLDLEKTCLTAVLKLGVLEPTRARLQAELRIGVCGGERDVK